MGNTWNRWWTGRGAPGEPPPEPTGAATPRPEDPPGTQPERGGAVTQSPLDTPHGAVRPQFENASPPDPIPAECDDELAPDFLDARQPSPWDGSGPYASPTSPSRTEYDSPRV